MFSSGPGSRRSGLSIPCVTFKKISFQKYCRAFKKYIEDIYWKNIFSNMFDWCHRCSLSKYCKKWLSKRKFVRGNLFKNKVFAWIIWSIRKYLRQNIGFAFVKLYIAYFHIAFDFEVIWIQSLRRKIRWCK